MNFDSATLFAFLLVFVRCSALLLSSPIFGAQSTPVQVRVFTTMAISGALTTVIRPHMQPIPGDLVGFVIQIGYEIVIGLLIGYMMTLALQVAQIAGAFMDIQVGLSSSQVLNPINGVSVTVLSQFKFLLGVVVFLSLDAHHLVIEALVRSYTATPNFTFQTFAELERNLVAFIKDLFLVAMQIAGPVIGVSLIIDAALGLVNRAVPQIQAMQVGLPVKIGMGLIAVSIGLPTLTGGISVMTQSAMKALIPIFR